MTKLRGVAMLAALLASLTSSLSAQSIFATLTGTVSDQSQALVPDAKITLKNTGSGDIRRTVTNADGYFTFAAVPVGSYDLAVEAQGFVQYEMKQLSFTGAEKRNVNVTLTVGSTSEKVEVVGTTAEIVPVDSGEKSAVLTTRQLQDFSVVGRSAAEFIKILPGFAISGTGTQNRAGFTGEVIGINGNGDGGSQSALNNAFAVNGQPTNSLDITADGAHVSDPGCNCATPVNPNTDMIQEFKVLTSNFSAENAKGPAVISSISKAGTNEFHGTAYMYARHHSLNSNDWLNNRLGLPKPANKFFFPGGNIGGPVKIPGTNFNKNRDKLFFFTGYEHYFQTLDTGVIRATVPTANMRTGNFSPAELARTEAVFPNGSRQTYSGGPAQSVNPEIYAGGIIPTNQIDGGGRTLMNLLPLPNVAPTPATNGANYVQQIAFDQNSRQWLTRVDYNISDTTKLFIRYNYQRERQLFPIGLWWRNGSQVPYPTEIVGKNQSDSWSASLTKVFSPTMTNEFVFGYTFVGFPNVFNDPAKVDRTKLGYPYKGLYKNGTPQIPAMTGWGGEFATMFNPGGFEVGGERGLFADKYLPTFTNNLTKVAGTHTLKFGAFFEYVRNNQPNNLYTNALIEEANWGGNSTGSSYADLLTGRVANYTEANFNNLNDIAYRQFDFFAQDSWKVSRRLTLDYGLRASHLGNWYDRTGNGYAVFAPETFNASAPPSQYSGFLWNKRDKNVPLTGFPNRALTWAPRFGMAWDIFGTGKTVMRGGWGQFYFHVAQFTNGLAAAAGVQQRGIGNTTLNAIETSNPGVGSIGIQGVDRNDDGVPKTQSYSFTIAQRIPWSSLVEISYVGNQSSSLLNASGVGTNVNAVPYGTFLPGRYAGNPNDVSQEVYDAARPIRGFQDARVSNHNLYQNYNSLQITWIRTKGRYNMQANYSFGKSLGIAGNGDEFVLGNNYGPLSNDRRHIFNAAYSVELGNPSKGNPFVKGIVNGWQLSGITQIQSGINLSREVGGNYAINTNNAQTVNGFNVSGRSINGTDSVALRPLVTCPLNSGLGPNQFVNPNCLAVPTRPGQNGPVVLPAAYGPAFVNSDLGMYKNFQLSESKKLQIRFNAYNFLNHPLWSFVDNTNLTFNVNPATGKNQNVNFGTSTEKQGRRIVQVAIKFYF